MCDFPAKKLLAERREVVETLPPYDAFERVKEIDRLRWKHAATGCLCWEEARAELAASREQAAA